MDIVDRQTRSRMMSGIRGKNTRIEIHVRKALHAGGLRYRLHNAKLPGRPDLAFPRFKAVVFVHGCFWHGHGCHLFKLPRTNSAFWETKIAANRARDAKAIDALHGLGWRVGVVWECALRTSGETAGKATSKLEKWIRKGTGDTEIQL